MGLNGQFLFWKKKKILLLPPISKFLCEAVYV